MCIEDSGRETSTCDQNGFRINSSTRKGGGGYNLCVLKNGNDSAVTEMVLFSREISGGLTFVKYCNDQIKQLSPKCPSSYIYIIIHINP